ncbi:hypothetical protein [Mesorhizobium sp. YM1C-6-2]|uniref:hypothetical protein n=1 Tax=Mesorhizobium sp. YM1C-6-2 TaxID=1827501 RepID=UPI000EF1C748|nr:hypothetical protein [Mesorhizobium sp. YM1C-6-2]RLP26313.1 hypothetical protein D8676_11625 [Mesorhizobium sp. YM1C-6-2]
MKFNNNPAFYTAVSHQVSRALHEFGIVNVAAIAASLRRQTPSENVYDIERAVLGYANLIGAPILFDRALGGGFDKPGRGESRGLLVEFFEGDPDALND